MSVSEESEKIRQFLLQDARPLLKGTAGKNPDLSRVVVWLNSYDSDTGAAILGLALGSGTGCSPFCGCAAKEISKYIGNLLKNNFSFIKHARGEACIPPQDVLDKWNSD